MLRILLHALVFVAIAALVCLLDWVTEPSLTIDVAPFEWGGGVLSLLLVLRTNSGYERWWEARKLWGGIVNQSRNLATAGLVYGAKDMAWRADFVRWVAAFAHAARTMLRRDGDYSSIVPLLGADTTARIAAAGHPALHVAAQIAERLNRALSLGMDSFAFLQADRERAALIDHLGGCERILKTPMPRTYAITLRQFIVVFLVTLPFALIPRVAYWWLTPLLTLLIAPSFLALDLTAEELQNPFAAANINNLPLEDICATIEKNLLGLQGREVDAS